MLQSFRSWLLPQFATRSDWLFAGLVLLCLVPIWIFPFFPTQDGAAHVENADLLANYWNHARPEIAAFYTLNPAALTNWVGHLLLAALMLFSSPVVAEKLFLSAYVVLFPLTARYALTAISHEARWLALLTLPLVYSLALYKGFYNFCAAIPLYFLLLGYWLRHRDRIRPRSLLVLVILSFLLYGAHVLAWVLGALAIGTLALWFVIVDVRRDHLPPVQQLRKRLVPVIVISILPAILVLLFVTRGTGAPLQLSTNWRVALLILVRMNVLVALDERDFIFAAVLLASLAGLFLYQLYRKLRTREFAVWDGWLAVLAVYFVFFMLVPGSVAGGSFVKQRVVMFLVFALLFWLAAQTLAAVVKSAVAIGVAVWVIGLMVIRLDAQRELAAQLQDLYTVTTHIEPHSTILPLTLASRIEPDETSTQLSRIRVLLHGVGYVSAVRQLINLTNYEARTDYFPFRYRSEVDPAPYFTKIATGAPKLRLDEYERATNVRVDYILLLLEDASFEESFQASPQLLAQLEQNYTQIFTSSSGHARLFRHN